MKELRGVPVSDGIAIAKILVLKKADRTFDQRMITPDEAKIEIQRFKDALESVGLHAKSLYESAKEKLGAEEAEIFAAHLSVVEDPMIEDGVIEKISDMHMGAESALTETLAEIEILFEQLNDEYLRERIADVKDVGGQILDNLLGIEHVDLNALPYPCIIAAEDLTPSETVSMDFEKTLGFMTELGGRTSHTAIISRSLEIPAVVGMGSMLSELENEAEVILDAFEGKVILNPTDEQIDAYKKKQEAYLVEKKELAELKDLPAVSKDGCIFELCANIGNPSDAKRVGNYGAEGIGLYRTEFLYMGNTHFPTEEEQFEAYKEVAEIMGEKPVIIRTLDIGGDKELPYYEFEKEENPFLGWRAIRICLDRTDIFKTQLRAILRASAFGKLRIMYPMIIAKEEFVRANEILEECKAELRAEGIAFDEEIQTGVMIETPAAVAIADILAKYADFFSIGTNDLCQYTLAVDRGNVKIANKYNPFSPAVLRNIKRVIDAAKKEGKMVGMCGEFAGDPQAALVLAAMGLDEFSMTASSIPKVKRIIRNLNVEEAKQKLDLVMQAETAEEIQNILN
ncbi:phosphoenolpyruvate--protein phosphotransferase [Ruminococcus sp. AF14-10]|nr:phosphoenolpyruvate--protein phosphotransferase [Ruminococcus sp. AF14-10]